MCLKSPLALAALYPHPATAHCLAPGMCAEPLCSRRISVQAAELRLIHKGKGLTS
jgi:hypothetical protein